MLDHPTPLLTAATGHMASQESLAVRFFDMLATWFERSRERRLLAQMGEAQLKDVGITRADIDTEAAKPFWRN